MRDLSEVVEKMITEIPEKHSSLHFQLRKVVEDSVYRAPEAMFLSWREVAMQYDQYIKQLSVHPGPGDFPDWVDKAGRILADLPSEDKE